MVVDLYPSPGSSSVEGKLGWLGESGKCWVSKHTPVRTGNAIRDEEYQENPDHDLRNLNFTENIKND